MNTRFSILMIVLLFSCSANNFTNDWLNFEVRLAESESGQNLREMTFYNSNQTFFIHDSVFLSNNDLLSAEVIDWQTQPKVKVTLNDEGRKKFADFTLTNIGSIIRRA